MKKLAIGLVLAASLSTASVAEPAKPKMNAADLENQMVVSSQGASSSSAALVIFGVTALVFVAALCGGSGNVASHGMSY